MQHNDMNEEEMMDKMDECIDECLSCHAVCMETMQHCLNMGGSHAAPEHITMLQACSEICQTSAKFMLMGSELHGLTCGVCAEVCTRCADSCDQFGDDEMMQACAEACRSCAESCREMEAMAHID